MSQDFELERKEAGFSLSYCGLELISGDFPFAFAGHGKESVSMRRGNFDISDYVEARLPLSLDGWERVSAGRAASTADSAAGAASASGEAEELRLDLAGGDARLRLTVRELRIPAACGEDDLWLELKFQSASPGLNRFWFRIATAPDERFYGCGEQFSHLDLTGRRFPLWTSEQGVGRNKSTPITFQADLDGGSGGDYWWTFYPEPSFVSSRGYYLHAETSAYAAFDFSRGDFAELEFWELPSRILIAPRGSMLGAARAASALLGRQPELPDWTQEGVILGIQGGTETCLAKLERALSRGVPVSGIWA
ncbi:MAG: hypothetical protein Q8M76_05110, partial [Spirochaetaceae bacterium]|nr:hypothetical protein [Spirochaetaceae bacterium]